MTALLQHLQRDDAGEGDDGFASNETAAGKVEDRAFFEDPHREKDSEDGEKQRHHQQPGLTGEDRRKNRSRRDDEEEQTEEAAPTSGTATFAEMKCEKRRGTSTRARTGSFPSER